MICHWQCISHSLNFSLYIGCLSTLQCKTIFYHNRDLDTQALVVPALAPVPFFIVFIYFTSIFISSYKPGFPIRDSRPPSVLVAKNEILRPAPADLAANVGHRPPARDLGSRMSIPKPRTHNRVVIKPISCWVNLTSAKPPLARALSYPA